MSKKKKPPLKSQATCNKKTCNSKKCSNKKSKESSPKLWDKLRQLLGW